MTTVICRSPPEPLRVFELCDLLASQSEAPGKISAKPIRNHMASVPFIFHWNGWNVIWKSTVFSFCCTMADVTLSPFFPSLTNFYFFREGNYCTALSEREGSEFSAGVLVWWWATSSLPAKSVPWCLCYSQQPHRITCTLLSPKWVTLPASHTALYPTFTTQGPQTSVCVQQWSGLKWRNEFSNNKVTNIPHVKTPYIPLLVIFSLVSWCCPSLET